MKTRICFHDVAGEVPAVGYEFFMVDVTFTNTGETRRDGHTEIQRTNQSREPRADGWLGTTNNIDSQARGKFRVTKVLSGQPKYFNQGVSVEIEKL